MSDTNRLINKVILPSSKSLHAHARWSWWNNPWIPPLYQMSSFQRAPNHKLLSSFPLHQRHLSYDLLDLYPTMKVQLSHTCDLLYWHVSNTITQSLVCCLMRKCARWTKICNRDIFLQSNRSWHDLIHTWVYIHFWVSWHTSRKIAWRESCAKGPWLSRSS